jgi:hypothetical protein
MSGIHVRAGALAAGLALTTLYATGAHAQGVEPTWRGLYVGGGGTYSTVSVKVDDGCYDDCWWGDYDEYDTGDGAYGYSFLLELQYRFGARKAADAASGTTIATP